MTNRDPEPPPRRTLALRVNGAPASASIPEHRTLLEVLREDLGLTGTKRGCDLGECGACTVLVDGEPRLACLTLAVEVEGGSVTTVEGLGAPGRPDPLQTAFVGLGAVQCGYCTPGMLLTARALLDRTPRPDRTDVVHALSGNLCRCTGYVKIIDAVLQAAREERAGGEGR